MQTFEDKGDARPDRETQYTLYVGADFNGTLEPPHDVDWFRAELTAGTLYEFSVSFPSGTTFVKLLDSEGNEVAYGFSDHPNFRDITFKPVVSGDYYLSIYGTSSPYYNYRIFLREKTAENYTFDEIADYLTDGYWEWQGDTRRAFDVEPGGVLTADITALNEAGQQLARRALEAWTDVSGIEFRFVDDNNAQIIFDDNGDQPATQSTVSNGLIISSRVTIPADLLLEYGATVESFSFTTYLHEIGHALGHPGEFDHLATLDDVYSVLDFPRRVSVMSYIVPADDSHISDGSIRPVTPSSADIIAIHNLYGKPDDNNAGDTVYGFQSNMEGYLGEFFTVLAGEVNPLHQFHLDSFSSPAFADLDGDGDQDLIVGTFRNRIDYYENTGTAGHPGFTQRFGSDNPMGGYLVYGFTEPVPADLDGDGDFDLMIVNGSIQYFENTGTAAGPEFTERTGASNPMDGINASLGAFDSIVSLPLADLDNDGDSDLVVTHQNGGIDFYENTGTIANPRFTQRSGAANPLENVHVTPVNAARQGGTALVDLDGDDDFDLIFLGWEGVNPYFENIGTPANPRFAERTGADNPLHGINEQTYGNFTFGDLDGDNDPDLIIVDTYGRVKYYENSGTLTDPDFTLKSLKHPVYLTLNDSGGNDTLDLSTDTLDQTIDLRPGGISEASGLRVVFLIAPGTLIENVVAGSGHDHIIGNTVANRLAGRPGYDYIWGNKGDDVLEGGAGGDRLDGGDGVDTVSYQGSDTGVAVDLGAHSGSSGHARHDTIFEVENIMGSAFGDELAGDDGANRLDGARGDDRLRGNGGNDLLEGGPGADELDGGGGVDTASYQESDAGVVVRLKENTGEKGHAEGDTFTGIENLRGSAYNDGLVGDDGANYLAGGEGNDGLWGGAGDDTLEGGIGADRLFGGSGADWASYIRSGAGVTVNLGDGTLAGGHAEGDALEEIENIRGSGYADTLTGDEAANRLDGRSGDDELDGGAGDDTLEGGSGADRLSGGSGSDWVSYLQSGAGVTVNLADGTGKGGHAEGDTFENVENVRGSRHADRLVGNHHANRLDGGAGNDLLEGGAGADRLSGGNGFDWASYRGSNTGVSVSLVKGTSEGGHATGDVITNIENLEGSDYDDVLIGDQNSNRLVGGDGNDDLRSYASPDVLQGGNGDDDLIGGSGNDRLEGGDGRDLLLGEQGDDRLDGGDGDDLLSGGPGADTLDGGDGNDLVSYQSSTESVRIDLEEGTVQGGHADGDTLISVEGAQGSDYPDVLWGDDNDNVFFGSGGDDELAGRGGDDALFGDLGDDSRVGDDILSGGPGNDFLHGGGGSDLLHGGEGDDLLYGGWGTDGLHGGEGADTFAFDEFSGDTLITDFTDGVDVIDLTHLGLSGFNALTLSSSPDGAVLHLDTQYGARVLFENFDVANLDASDFLF